MLSSANLVLEIQCKFIPLLKAALIPLVYLFFMLINFSHNCCTNFDIYFYSFPKIELVSFFVGYH